VILITLDSRPDGANLTVSPALRLPASTRPIGTVPTPPIRKTLLRGILSGLSLALFGALSFSRAYIRVSPLNELSS